MSIKVPCLALVAFTLSGCAAGFRAGGPNAGVDAGVGVGPVPPPAVSYYPAPVAVPAR